MTPHRLARVERAEAAVRAALAAHGLSSTDLRVRDLGAVGRVELDRSLVDGACASGTPAHAAVCAAVAAAGFDEAAVDPRGFRSGSLNEALARPE